MLASLSLVGGCRRPEVVRGSAPEGASFAEAPGEPSAVRTCLLERLPAGLEESAGLPLLAVAVRDDPLFPPAEQLRLTADLDPALMRYALLDEAERELDLFLHDPQDRYWRTEEWTADGAPTLFRSDFLLHLEPASGGTRIEVIEVQPRVDLGERFSWKGHNGPGWYRDIRRVAPTASELQLILQLCLAACA